MRMEGLFAMRPSDEDTVFVRIALVNESKWGEQLKKHKTSDKTGAVWHRTSKSDTTYLVSENATWILTGAVDNTLYALTRKDDGQRSGYHRHNWILSFKNRAGNQLKDYFLHCAFWMPESAFWINDSELWLKARAIKGNDNDQGNHVATDFTYLKMTF